MNLSTQLKGLGHYLFCALTTQRDQTIGAIGRLLRSGFRLTPGKIGAIRLPCDERLPFRERVTPLSRH
jgi:hypothetical protein